MKVHWSVAPFLVIPIAWAAVVFLAFRSINTTEWSPLQRMLLFMPVFALSWLFGMATARAHRFVVRRRQQEVARQQAAAEGLPDLWSQVSEVGPAQVSSELQHLKRVAEAAGALIATDDELRRRRIIQQLAGDDPELCELRESLIQALRAALRGGPS